jgi:hypothetical protein
LPILSQMFLARIVGRRTAVVGLFLANCLLVGVLVGSGTLDIPRPFAWAVSAAITSAELSFWLMWARSPVPKQAGVQRFSEFGRRLDVARQSAIRVEDTELYRRWYLEFRIKQEAERCSVYDTSMAVVVIRLGSTDLAAWSGNFWATQSSSATLHLLKFVRGTDICAPLGPLEFAILLVECGRDGGELAAARIAELLEADKCEVGVAALPEDKCEPLALIELARGRLRARRVAA